MTAIRQIVQPSCCSLFCFQSFDVGQILKKMTHRITNLIWIEKMSKVKNYMRIGAIGI